MVSISPNETTQSAHRDAVTVFETHRAQARREKLMMNLLLVGLFLLLLGWSIYVSRFYPDRLATGIPRILEYFASVIPSLNGEVLFDGRNAAGRFPPGSIGFWYNDFWKYLGLIWETILMALTATILGTAFAGVLAFLSARNTAPPHGLAPLPGGFWNSAAACQRSCSR